MYLVRSERPECNNPEIAAAPTATRGTSDTPFAWNESLPQRNTTNETRLSFDPYHGFSGIAGMYISQQHSNEIDNGGSARGREPHREQRIVHSLSGIPAYASRLHSRER